MVAPALRVVTRLAETGLLTFAGGTVRLTAQGRLLSNDVFQEFLGLIPDADFVRTGTNS
jgi:coproporphyrinogen III oxidase-like Fe-S oxidoreductase